MTTIITRSEAKALGLTRYFTGLTCIRGHVSERWTSSSKCLACHYEENPLNPKIRLSPDEAARRQKENKRRYYLKNLEVHKARGKQWKKDHPESIKQSWARWREKPKNKLITFMRGALRRVLTREKSARTEVMLGYTRQEIEQHIEKQFQRGMSWANYGEWHIDHIIPIAHFLNNGIEDPAVINCLSNLRPIWADENHKKNAKVESLL